MSLQHDTKISIHAAQAATSTPQHTKLCYHPASSARTGASTPKESPVSVQRWQQPILWAALANQAGAEDLSNSREHRTQNQSFSA
jgi:choline dehydrogenase-like flavoprotein